jgi:hypothetical protein
LAVEVKSTPVDFSEAQLKLLEKINLNFVAHWSVGLPDNVEHGQKFENSKIVSIDKIARELAKIYK